MKNYPRDFTQVKRRFSKQLVMWHKLTFSSNVKLFLISLTEIFRFENEDDLL